MYIYIFMYTHYIYISLSIYIYIYIHIILNIYIYIHTPTLSFLNRHLPVDGPVDRWWPTKDSMDEALKYKLDDAAPDAAQKARGPVACEGHKHMAMDQYL